MLMLASRPSSLTFDSVKRREASGQRERPKSSGAHLSTDDDGDGERQQEDRGHDDVHRALRSSSLPRTKQMRDAAADPGGSAL